MRVEWDSKISESVDATLRIIANSRSMRRSHRKNIFVGCIFIAVLMGIITYFVVDFILSGPRFRMVKILFSSFIGLTHAVFYPWSYWYQIKNKLRKYYREHIGPEDRRVIIELTPEGIISSQSGTHIMFAWSSIEEITETADSIDFFTSKGGGVIVRKRAFASDTECENYHDAAMALWEAHRGVAAESKNEID